MSKQRGLFEKIPGSGMWWIRYADANGRIRREKAGTKGTALKLYRKRKTEALQGKKLPETLRGRAVTFRALIADALEHARAHCTLPRAYESRAELLLSWFGDRVAESITPQELDRRLDEVMRERGWRPATVNRHKSLISLAYSLGMRNGKIETNPARLVRARREDNGRIRFLSDEEQSRLYPLIPARHLPEFYIALNTGMRLSEQYGLIRDCVSLDRKMLTVPRSKNGRARHIPLNAQAMAAFEWLLSQRVDDGNGSGEHVFLNYENALSGHAPKWFARALKEAGIAGFSWDCLRHTFASRLVMAGVDLRTVQELMGHRNIAMTCRYAHLAPAHQRAAVEALDKARQRGSTDTKTSTSDTTALTGGETVAVSVQ